MYLVGILFTVFSFVFFISIVLLTYRKKYAKNYDDIANFIIEDNDNYIDPSDNFSDKSIYMNKDGVKNE